MISYNWGHQPIVKQICSNLRKNGIKVWMDVDDMQGSTLQAMASAVEKADIVLVCYSHKYKNSDNCRAGMLQLNSVLVGRWAVVFWCATHRNIKTVITRVSK